MNKYQLNLNLGSEVLGSGKTITATEVVESASSKELAREVAHLAPLVDERTAQYVLDNVLAAATQLMSEGLGSGSPDSGEGGDDDNTEL